MTWNLLAEWTALVFAIVLLIDSRRGIQLQTIRDRLFRFSTVLTILAIVSDLLSAHLIGRYQTVPAWLSIGVTTVYFLITPLLAVIFFYYTVSVLFYDRDFGRINRLWYLCLLPYAFYVGLMLINPFQETVFDITAESGYTQGPWIFSTTAVFMVYCLAVILLAVLRRKTVSLASFWVLLIFPILSIAVIVVQDLLPDNSILSGTASVLALLIIYLYLQNQRSISDEKTGLLNRAMVLHAIKTAIRNGRPFTAAELSIDRFKAINDRFGQDLGDRFLKEIAQALVAIAGADHVYRFVGDQFILLLTGEERGKMDAYLARVVERFSRVWDVGEAECLLTGSIGVVSYPEAGGDISTLLTALDYSNAQAKAMGWTNICRYEKDMMERVHRREQVEKVIRDAIAEGGTAFTVLYQPIWSIAEQRFNQAEALVRMDTPEFGRVYPDEFIPIAEETGLIVELTYIILRKVCRFQARLNRLSPEGISPLTNISVNFSALEFLQPDMEHRVHAAVAEAGIRPSQIKIEITERTLVSNSEQVEAILLRLHKNGIAFALDDFGMGYSNVGSILQLPFQVIKLDKSLMEAAYGDADKTVFLSNIIEAFLGLGCLVVSEGVETAAQCLYMETCGVTAIQGYYYAKPMPESEVEGLLFTKAS